MQRTGDGASGTRVCNERPPYLDYRETRNVGMGLGMGSGSIRTGQVESKYLRRYKMLTRELSQIERENLAIFNELKSSKVRVERLRFEHKLLLEKLGEIINSRRAAHSDKKGIKLVLDPGYEGRHCHCPSSNSGSQHYVHRHQDQYEKLRKHSPDVDPWNSNNPDSASSTCSEWLAQQENASERHSCHSNRDDQYLTPFKKSKRQKSKDRDPNAPKRPSNAFMYFCEMQREALKKQRENLDEHEQEKAGLNNLTKALGSRWQALSEDERKKWKEMFLMKVEKYYSDMKCYKGNNCSGAPQAVSQHSGKSSTLDSFPYIPCGSSSKSDDEKSKSPQTLSDRSTKNSCSNCITPRNSKDILRKSHSAVQTKRPRQEGSPSSNTNCPQENQETRNEPFEISHLSSSSQSELSDLDPNMLGDMESDSMDQDSRNSKDSDANSHIGQQDN